MASKANQKPQILNRKDGLYLMHTALKGRGVFCTHDIKAGETLEVTPAIILDEAATNDIAETILMDYVFIIGKPSKSLQKAAGLKNVKNASCVVMGITSYCNHSEKPNAEVLWDEHGGSLYYMVQATRNIPKNTEICTSYGNSWFDDRD